VNRLKAMNLEQHRQNEVRLLADAIDRMAQMGILVRSQVVATAAVSTGVTKGFFIRRQLIVLKESLRHEVTAIQTEIRANKAKHLDTSKLKGRLHGIEAVRKALRAILHTPRAEAVTVKDRLWLAKVLDPKS